MIPSAKRIFDVTLAAASAIIFSPFLAVTALAVAVTSGETPVMTVTRIGKDGKLFSMYKFRSLSTDETLSEEERKTPVGRFIRATSIDELPQIFNILKGDMSFVGPRPHSLDEQEQVQNYPEILRVLPGLTGAWQAAAVGRPAAEDLTERLELERAYALEKPSLRKDFMLMARCLPAVFKGHDGESLKKPAKRSP